MLLKKDLQAILDSLPEDTTFWVRSGDDAFPTQVRAFIENGKTVVYFQSTGLTKCGLNHRNFPEPYVFTELKLPR